MTKALQDAFKLASRLPDDDQDALAAAILEEVALEEHWEATLAGSSGALGELADEALADHRRGRSEPLDPKKL
jgi:hypothetical protein